MALENITVNGKPLKQFIEKEKSDEIRDFYLYELRTLSSGGRNILSSQKYDFRKKEPVRKAVAK
jgi:hypothetical protein